MKPSIYFSKILPKYSFVRNVSILAGGTFIGQIINVICSPLLTRLYAPEDFGLLAIYSSLLMMIGAVVNLRYQIAIPLPDEDVEAAHLVILSLIVMLCIVIIGVIGVIFCSEYIAKTIRVPAIAKYLYLLPLGLFLMGVYQVFSFWAIRKNTLSTIARTKLTQAIGRAVVQLGGAFLGPIALIIGQIVGQASGAVSLITMTISKHKSAFTNISISGLKAVAWRYKYFPIFSSWGLIFYTAGTHLPSLLFASLFSANAAGIYLLTQRVLEMPISLVGKSISDAFLSSASEDRRGKNIKNLVSKIYYYLVLIALPPTLLLVLFGSEIFQKVFGSDWKAAGQFAQWMAPYVFLRFVSSPLSVLFAILEKQVHEFVFQGALLIIRISALLVGAFLSDIIIALALFSTGSFIYYLAIVIWEIKVSGNSWITFLHPIIIAMLVSIIILFPMLIFYAFVLRLDFWILAFGLSLLLLAFWYFFLLKKSWFQKKI